MQIIISARHVELGESLKDHLDERFQRLGRFDGNVSRIDVTLSEEKQRCRIEARVSTRRGAGVHAGAEARDFRTAIDRLYEKLSRQLKTRREKVRDRKGAQEHPVVTLEDDVP